MRLIKYTLFVIFIFFHSIATPAPSIVSTSGNFYHNQTVTISVNSPGTKPTAAPLKWENFEDGTVGQNIETTGYWSMKETGTIRPVFSNTGPRTTVSPNNIYHHQYGIPYDSSNGMGQYWKNNIGFATTKKAFVSIWGKIDWGPGGSTDSNGYQIKFFRILKSVYDDSGNMTYPSIANFNWYNPDNSKKGYFAIYGNQDYLNSDPAISDSVSEATYIRPSATLMPQDTWFNVQIQYSASTSSGANDATFEVWWQNTNVAYTSKSVTVCPGYSCSFDSPNETDYANELMDAIKVEFNFDNVDDSEIDINCYSDDIYIDNTWARIEIGDNATYSSCTKREMQIPSAWSDGIPGSVTFKVNRGSFALGDTAYLFVVDSDGAASSGYEIQFSYGGGVALTGGTGSILPGGPGSLTW